MDYRRAADANSVRTVCLPLAASRFLRCFREWRLSDVRARAKETLEVWLIAAAMFALLVLTSGGQVAAEDKDVWTVKEKNERQA